MKGKLPSIILLLLLLTQVGPDAVDYIGWDTSYHILYLAWSGTNFVGNTPYRIILYNFDQFITLGVTDTPDEISSDWAQWERKLLYLGGCDKWFFW